MRFDIEPETHQSQKKRKKNNKLYFILLFFFLFVFLILLITYLILSKDTPKRNVKPITQIEDKKEPEAEVQIYDEKSNDRPIAFMIDNNIGEAKHAGLQDSYINYEIIVEGGLTRIMAIYKDNNVKLIGPIRSARHYFLDYALENDAIYAHYGWSPQAENDIKELKVDNINGITDPTPYRRDEKSIAPHNVFTNISYIKDYLDKKNYSNTSSTWKLLNISANEISLGESESLSAKKAIISYSENEYRTYAYDEVNKYYIRSQNGKPHLDRLTNEQLHYKNIIVLKIENETIDNEGRQTLNNIGSGEGYYITNGSYRKINWSKESRISKTNLTYTNGSAVTLNDGNTFVQIVPINSNITIE